MSLIKIVFWTAQLIPSNTPCKGCRICIYWKLDIHWCLCSKEQRRKWKLLLFHWHSAVILPLFVAQLLWDGMSHSSSKCKCHAKKNHVFLKKRLVMRDGRRRLAENVAQLGDTSHERQLGMSPGNGHLWGKELNVTINTLSVHLCCGNVLFSTSSRHIKLLSILDWTFGWKSSLSQYQYLSFRKN